MQQTDQPRTDTVALRPAPAEAEGLLAWIAGHERTLRPYLAASSPGGQSPRMCLDLARSQALHAIDSRGGLLNCVFHVLHAYRVAGLLDRRGEAEQWHAALNEIAGHLEQAGDNARAEELRRQAESDRLEMLALEATAHGLPQ